MWKSLVDAVTTTCPPPLIVDSCCAVRSTVCVCRTLLSGSFTFDDVYVAPLGGGAVRSDSGTHSVWVCCETLVEVVNAPSQAPASGGLAPLPGPAAGAVAIEQASGTIARVAVVWVRNIRRVKNIRVAL